MKKGLSRLLWALALALLAAVLVLVNRPAPAAPAPRRRKVCPRTIPPSLWGPKWGSACRISPWTA